MFQACLNLRLGVGDPNKELDVLFSSNSSHIYDKCNEKIMKK